MRPDLVRVAIGIDYDPATGHLVIDGLRFSPEVLATMTAGDGSWRGPFWIRRDDETVTITTIDPVATSRASGH